MRSLIFHCSCPKSTSERPSVDPQEYIPILKTKLPLGPDKPKRLLLVARAPGTLAAAGVISVPSSAEREEIKRLRVEQERDMLKKSQPCFA